MSPPLTSKSAVFTAMALAAAVSALCAALVTGDWRTAPLSLIVVAPHALLGLIIYAMSSSTGELTLRRALVSGFLVGTVPVMLLTVIEVADSASVGGVATVVDGRRTAAGWLQWVSFSALYFGGCGAVAGLTFWGALRPLPHWLEIARPVLAVIAVGGITAIPAISKDRSCHNSLRDGRDAVYAEASVVVAIEVADWPNAVAIFKAFGAKQGWSVRRFMTTESRDYQHLDLSVCHPSGTRISAIAVETDGPDPIDGLRISVFQPQGGSGWHSPARRLIETLEARWPGRLEHIGEDGNAVSAPPWMTDPSP